MMNRYEKFKPAGIEWLGEIPVQWDAIRLKFLLERNDGGIWGDDYDGIEENATKVFRSTEINVDGSWNLNEEPALRLLSAQEKTNALLKEGDLLVTKSSGSQLHIGKTALVTKDIEELQCCFSNFTQRLRPKNKKGAQYLHIFLNSQLSRNQYNYLSNSTTGLANLSAGLLADVIIPTPLPEEQTAIAKYLDDKTAQIDTLIANKQRLIELLKEERTAIINQAVTKGINPKVKLKPNGIEWLGDIPEHWEVKKLKYVAEVKYGLGQPPRQKADGLPLIRATNVERGKIVAKDLIYVDPDDIPYDRDPVLKENDIIVVRSGAYTADSAIIPKEYEGAITGYDMVVRAINADPIFISYCLLSNYVLINELYLHRLRAAQPHLNKEDLGETFLLLPPVQEQQSIVRHIKTSTSKIDATISKIEKEIDLLQEYRTALISEVVTGKIKVA
jgi:type I restriction enzyme S subunit